MALYSAILGDPATLTGAKHLGLDYPMGWEGLAVAFQQRGYLFPAPLRIGADADEHQASDEEMEKAKAKLSPFPKSDVRS